MYLSTGNDYLKRLLKTCWYDVYLYYLHYYLVTLFKCGQSATDCSECLAVDPQKRKCGWCSSNGACTVELECTAGWNGKESVDCPEPFISTIAPKRGPIEGGTKLTIKGSNLGVRFQDIVSVKVNDQECDLREELYSPGKTSVVRITVFCILL